MDLAREFLPRAFTVALAFSRTAGFATASPFPGQNAGPTQRVGFALALAAVAGLFVPVPAEPLSLDARLATGAASELAIGLTIGVAFRFVFVAAEMLSQSVSQVSGLGAPSTFNPTFNTQETALSQALTLFAMLVALSIGAHRVAIASVSLDAAAPVFVDLAAESLAVGLRLAMPVVVISLATQTALALISRAAPSLQLFSVGLAVLIAASIMVLMASLGDITLGLGEHLGGLGPRLARVLLALTPQSP
jgi:flagellar biosynthetic protein FliR